MQSLYHHAMWKYEIHTVSLFIRVQRENTAEIIILVTALSCLLNMVPVLLVPSLAPSDPELDRCTLPSDSSGWSKTQNTVFPRHNLVSLEKKGKYHLETSYKEQLQDNITQQHITRP